MLKIYLFILLFASLITTIAFIIDKIASKRDGTTRIPESVLLSLIALGGAPGGMIGIFVFRHKSSFSNKFQFSISVWIALIIQLSIIVYLALIRYNIITF